MTAAQAPETIIHADWGKEPPKRWMSVATAAGHEHFLVGPTEQTDRLAGLLDRGLSGRSTLAGFDFPIGVPAQYGVRTPFGSFRDFLRALQTPEWSTVFELANAPEEISIWRPCYPDRVGGRRQQHLMAAHGVNEINDLRRRCERRTETRRAACPLFWTLGGNQVGRGALAGWRELIVPLSLRHGRAALWPFDGSLANLLTSHPLVICETYPAGDYPRVGAQFNAGDSKRRQTSRKRFGLPLLAAASALGVTLTEDARTEVLQGFGDRPNGEDRFDAFVGLLGMVRTCRDRRDGAPNDPETRKWEGWILGHEA